MSAIAESGSAIAGTASAPIANVAANDTVNGSPALLGASGNATIAQLGTWPGGIVLDPTTGVVSISIAVPVGTYSIPYQLCDLIAPPDCASATDTVIVAASIVAVAETGSAVVGTASAPIANVAANDTVNGAPALLGASGNATVAQLGTWPGGIVLDPTTGIVSISIAVPAGTYSIPYQLCDLIAPPDCASATDTVIVAASIVATADTGSADAAIASKAIANVAANDTVNGAPALLGASGNATVAQLGAWPGGIALNTSTGAINTTVAVPVGTYSIQYQLCDRNTPANCAIATDTISVINALIVATADTGSADAGIASKAIATVAANDTVNGAPASLGSSGNAAVGQIGTWPVGIALNTSTGAISTTAAVPAGTYSVQYWLCDRNSPAKCAGATDTISVINAVLVATAETGNADAGIASRAIANAAANDTVNGAPALLGTSGNAAVGQIGTWPTGIALNTSTGAINTTAALPAGTYSVQYRLCDRNTPAKCATATDTISVITASIVATPDKGSADAGIASTPIANVAANDTVSGAAAVLGTSGNATVAPYGSWPTGITLSASTGTVSTTVAVPAGRYSVQYALCDKNTLPKCTAATDTVTVITASIVAIPDSGNGFVGVVSTPIANVAANDSLNGASALLGTSGNATVAPIGTWPTGIALNTSTGAITAMTTVQGGTYSLAYQLCDRNAPPKCASTTDTVTLITASIVATPDTGNGTVGVESTPIANVAANDIVNGAPATLGTSGNATVAQLGTWPSGISLNASTGAITAAAAVQGGTYSLQYQLCDKNIPATCAVTTDTVTESFMEVQVSATVFGDIEFDWGRDGVYCAACNFGQGNARFNWTDKNGNLWIGHVDPNTGAYTPPAGDNELADTSAFYYGAFGNGPEWAFSTQSGQIISQLVYTRYTPGMPPVTANAGAAFATPVSGGWIADFFPAAIGISSSGAVINTIDPVGGQCKADPVALTVFSDLSTPRNVYWQPTTQASGTAPIITPFGPYATVISGGKPSLRWIPCTRDIVFVGAAPPDPSGTIYQQVFWYDIDTQVVQQLTVDQHSHTEAFIFQAPEFNDTPVLVTISDNLEIEIYEQTGVGNNGAPIFALVNLITSPDPAAPYIIGTEPFINCTPACQTYVFMKLESIVSNFFNITTVPNGVAVTNINPAQPLFKILVPQAATPTIQRMDLEYYITASGPFLYFNRNTVSSATTQFQQHGSYYIDMQLGAPSGPCVGSSAEGGMMPGC